MADAVLFAVLAIWLLSPAILAPIGFKTGFSKRRSVTIAIASPAVLALMIALYDVWNVFSFPDHAGYGWLAAGLLFTSLPLFALWWAMATFTYWWLSTTPKQ